MAEDCNDNDTDINPGATEICNDGKDNDCNGVADDRDPACEGFFDKWQLKSRTLNKYLGYTDADNDSTVAAEDCNDNDPYINPAATEICDDSVDNNCDGVADAEDPYCQGMTFDF